MWMEDRWFSSDECMEMTLHKSCSCVVFLGTTYVTTLKALQMRQDAIVSHLFQEDPKSWFKMYGQDTYMPHWDGNYCGFVSKNTIFELSKKVNILGPLARVFRRDLELEVATHQGRFDYIPTRVIETSIENHPGALRRDHYEVEPSKASSWTCAPVQSSSYKYWS